MLFSKPEKIILWLMLAVFSALIAWGPPPQADASSHIPQRGMAGDQCLGIDGTQSLLPLGPGIGTPDIIQLDPNTRIKISGGLVPCSRRCNDPLTSPMEEDRPCSFCHFFWLLKITIDWIITRIAPAVGALLVVFGGFMLATSRGDPGQASFAKRIVIWTFIGYAVILTAWVMVNTLLAGIGLEQWTGLTTPPGPGWWNFTCP